MKSICKKIKLNAIFGRIMKYPWGNQKVGFNIKGLVNRKDWGLNWNSKLEAGSFLKGEEVAINFEVELIKK